MANGPTGRFDIGGRSLALACQGHGSPAVILEAGLGNDRATWQPILRDVAALTQVCAYDRAGLGSSDPAPTPRTAADLVDDLHALLDAAGIERPVVLVGHSFGGLSGRLYAADRPDEVSGLVVVDGTPAPGFRDGVCLAVPKADCTKFWKEAFSENSEGLDVDASEAELREAPPLHPMPLIVLVAMRHDCDPGAFSTEGVCVAIDRVARRLADELVASEPGARLVLAESGHYIQEDQPEAVITAIRDVVNGIRSGSAPP